MYIANNMFKKTINFVYEDKLDLEKFNKIIEPVKNKYNIEIYNELNNKERRKAIMIKSKFGARLNPFIGITNEGKILQGFYRESCDSLYHFERYLSNSKKVDPRIFIDFIDKCLELGLTKDIILYNIKQLCEE